MSLCVDCFEVIDISSQVLDNRKLGRVMKMCRKCYNIRHRIRRIKRKHIKNIHTNCPKDYINQKVIKNDCWIWCGYIRTNGYAPVDNTKWGKLYKVSSAHQLAYVIYKGDYNRELYICHTCHNKTCVNPGHLYAGTPSDNVRDMVNAGRAAWQLKNKGRWRG